MIDTRLHGDVLEIEFRSPPVNALGANIRLGIAQAIRAAQTDERVNGIVLRGGGKLFSGGADISEFGHAFAEPALPELVEIIERSDKPVVAAIRGFALGGGLEIAMGCHYRVATADANLGLPEVKLGLLPGAGGTQRLPRLIGPMAALDLIVSGDLIAGQRGAELGLIDQVADDDELVTCSINAARSLATLRRTADLTLAPDPLLFERFTSENQRRIGALDAPAACVEAVRAATECPFAEGLKRERELFQELVGGEQSIGLRHAFFAERTAAKIDGLPKGTSTRAIAKVGIVGAGTMGGGIAMNFLSAGLPVTLVETSQDALDRGTAIVRRNYDATAAKGRLTSEQVAKAMNFLSPSLDLTSLADCDLVIEAVYENMEVKKELFARLDHILRADAILASNTSFLDIDEIASATARPESVLGLHFFSPANVMKLVEVIRGARTANDVLATAMELTRRVGKIPVISGVCYGFIGNRMLLPRQEEAESLLIEGATPEQIDRVHIGIGLPMGPFQMLDLAGVDIGWHRDASRIETLRDALCAAGRWGQKKAAGFYDYDQKRRASPSPVVEEIVATRRRAAGVKPRAVSDEEIMVRTIYTMINEGAKILDERIAQRSSDIDVVWLYGYGWPRHTGGPMFWAERLGFGNIIRGLTDYRGVLGKWSAISPLLVRAVEHNISLDVARNRI